MEIKWTAAFLLAFLIGAVCRRLGVPCPAPPSLLGGLLVLTTSLGFWAAGYLD